MASHPGGSDGKECTCNVGYLGSIPRLRRSPGKGHGNPLQYFCLENPSDRVAWQATVHGVTKSQTWLSHFHVHLRITSGFPGGSDGKESACNVGDSGLIPWVGKISWRRKWQPTPVFLPGESHGQKSLAGYSPWGHKAFDPSE